MKLISFMLGSVLILAACGGSSPLEVGESGQPSTTTAPTDPNQTSVLMAAALEQLVSIDHTFGEGPPPFTEYLVQRHTDPAAGDPAGDEEPSSRPLTELERTAIEDAISQFGSLRWIEEPADWRTDDLLPVVFGSVILGVGEPEINGKSAFVAVSLWCGGLCGTWFTYRAELLDGTWQIIGIEGAVAVA